MRFNWKKFCQDYNIEYVEEGPNVKRGEIAITCPNCGDPSHHLGLNSEKGWFSCWRCDVQGKRPEILIQKLLKCSRDEAKRIVGKPVRDTLDFSKQVKGLLKADEQEEDNDSVSELDLPSQFKPIANSTSSYAKPFKNFLVNRGFDKEDVDYLGKYYDLRYCLTGFWKNRIIIPVWIDGDLITWSSRTINPDDSMRYITLSPNREIEGFKAVDNITNYCFPYDQINYDFDVLFITEGQFDAVTIDFYGQPKARAVCVFGSSPSDSTVEYITDICYKHNVKRIVVFFDDITFSLKASQYFSHLNPEIYTLQDGRDPGDLNKEEVEDLVNYFI